MIELKPPKTIFKIFIYFFDLPLLTQPQSVERANESCNVIFVIKQTAWNFFLLNISEPRMKNTSEKKLAMVNFFDVFTAYTVKWYKKYFFLFSRNDLWKFFRSSFARTPISIMASFVSSNNTLYGKASESTKEKYCKSSTTHLALGCYNICIRKKHLRTWNEKEFPLLKNSSHISDMSMMVVRENVLVIIMIMPLLCIFEAILH